MTVELSYLASREWLETEMLSGQRVRSRHQRLSVDLESVPDETSKRISAILDETGLSEDSQKVEVFDSGVNPWITYVWNDGRKLKMDEPILLAIGALPELTKPTDHIESVLAAWEDWLASYKTIALEVIEGLQTDQPAHHLKADWSHEFDALPSFDITFGDGMTTTIDWSMDPECIRDALAGSAWLRAAKKRFPSSSFDAAAEATSLPPNKWISQIKELPPSEQATHYLRQKKRLFLAAKAHDRAVRSSVFSFEAEMRKWASDHGSERLQLGIEDGYRMNARYLAERLAKEAPGFYAMAAQSAESGWASKASSPSEEALRLRRAVQIALDAHAPSNVDGIPEAEIVVVKSPPHQIYLAESNSRFPSDAGLPARDGWPWWTDQHENVIGGDPIPFEAVVVRNWLGRFHLIGAVDSPGSRSKMIWAIPDLEDFGPLGNITPSNPDAEPPNAARIKPPKPDNNDDDIPF